MKDEESDGLECGVRGPASADSGLRTPDAERPPEPGFRPVASLAFWCCLAVSASLFATVFLAPRLRTFRDLRREYDGLQRELLTTEGQVDYLQKVVDALQHDPDFAAELARVDFGVSGSAERIPVAPQLSLKGELPVDNARGDVAARPFPGSLLDTPFLDTVTDDRSVRRSLLGTASFVLLVAFTFLCQTRSESPEPDRIDWGKRCRCWLAERYARTGR